MQRGLQIPLAFKTAIMAGVSFLTLRTDKGSPGSVLHFGTSFHNY